MTPPPDRTDRAVTRTGSRAVDHAAVHGMPLGAPRVRERLLVHTEGAFSALTAPRYTAHTNWALLDR